MTNSCDTTELRAIADTIESNGGWRIAAIKVRAAADEIEQLQRKAIEWAGIAGTHAGEIYELQQRVAAARALLEPLAEHDQAVREWLK